MGFREVKWVQIQHGPKEGFLFLLANDQVEDALVKSQILHSHSRSCPNLKCWQNVQKGRYLN